MSPIKLADKNVRKVPEKLWKDARDKAKKETVPLSMRALIIQLLREYLEQ